MQVHRGDRLPLLLRRAEHRSPASLDLFMCFSLCLSLAPEPPEVGEGNGSVPPRRGGASLSSLMPWRGAFAVSSHQGRV